MVVFECTGKRLRQHVRQSKIMAVTAWVGGLGETLGVGATMPKMTTISSLAIVLGLSVFSASSAVAGTLYDAQLGDWGRERVDASRGFFLPGVGPSSSRASDTRHRDAPVASCRSRISEATGTSGEEGTSDADTRARCERRPMSRR